MKAQHITIIGGGNMGGAIAKGIVASGLAGAGQITVTRRTASALADWQSKGYKTTTDNKEAVGGADIIVFAVKPYLIMDVIAQVKESINPKALCISVATGVSLSQLEGALPSGMAIVRAMPNTAAEVGESVTALCPLNVSDEQLADAQEIFSKMGLAIVIEEAKMPAITALASCGIAHALRFIRAMMEAGIEMGLTSKQSAEIAAQTAKGAAQLILTNGSHPEVEVDKVCTPAGVTITGINAMEHAGFTSAVIKGIMGSFNKIKS
ncbi:MAG: pyrroline-5-carboxylate reductase [Bacteroidales bacterium]|nr:pyrroline-5-carboxylate reductase [Bacteroidales bacterium]